jgi:hypothetical protein
MDYQKLKIPLPSPESHDVERPSTAHAPFDRVEEEIGRVQEGTGSCGCGASVFGARDRHSAANVTDHRALSGSALRLAVHEEREKVSDVATGAEGARTPCDRCGSLRSAVAGSRSADWARLTLGGATTVRMPFARTIRRGEQRSRGCDRERAARGEVRECWDEGLVGGRPRDQRAGKRSGRNRTGRIAGSSGQPREGAQRGGKTGRAAAAGGRPAVSEGERERAEGREMNRWVKRLGWSRRSRSAEMHEMGWPGLRPNPARVPPAHRLCSFRPGRAVQKTQ